MKQVVRPRVETPQEESVAQPETPMLIIFNLVCKFSIREIHQN